MAILNSVIPMPSLKDKCITGGRLNLTKFFKTTGQSFFQLALFPLNHFKTESLGGLSH